MQNNKLKAFAYTRTSSATNVGGDFGERQLIAIRAYAKAAKVEIVDTYTDDAVRGDNVIENRPGFASMLEKLLSNGVRTIIVETANRFARDLIVQEVGYEMLKARGITLIAADKPDAFLDDGPTAVLIRQVLGAVSQFEKSMLVSKLRGARERKRATGVRVEGRIPLAEKFPAAATLARQLHREHYSLREISADSRRRLSQYKEKAVLGAIGAEHAGLTGPGGRGCHINYHQPTRAGRPRQFLQFWPWCIAAYLPLTTHLTTQLIVGRSQEAYFPWPRSRQHRVTGPARPSHRGGNAPVGACTGCRGNDFGCKIRQKASQGGALAIADRFQTDALRASHLQASAGTNVQRSKPRGQQPRTSLTLGIVRTVRREGYCPGSNVRLLRSGSLSKKT